MFLCFLIEWDVQEVKTWAKELFNDEVAENFEKEDIGKTTLQSEIILTDESMNSLGLTTIGKEDKFVVAAGKLLVNPDFYMSLFIYYFYLKLERATKYMQFEHLNKISGYLGTLSVRKMNKVIPGILS